MLVKAEFWSIIEYIKFEEEIMNAYQIIIDTNSDLPQSYVKENNLLQIPQYYSIGDTIYEGAGGIEPTEFYKMMREGVMPQSQAINPAVVEDTFRSVLDDGKAILYLSFSGALSGSCDIARMVAKQLIEEDYPEGQIEIVDTLTVSLGEGLLINKALQLQAQGKSIEEIRDWLEENKHHQLCRFTVDDLFHLQRGGRVSKTTAVVGSILNIKPLLELTPEGKLGQAGTVRGRKKSLLALVDYIEAKIKGYEDMNDMVGIVHGDCLEDAQFVAEQVTKRFGITNVMINDVNPSIGVHSGPGALGLLFFGSER